MGRKQHGRGVGLLVCMLVAASGALAAGPDKGNCLFHMTFAGGAGKDKSLEIHGRMKDGACVAAFAEAKAFNTVPHDVPASVLNLASGSIMGPVPVTVRPDMTKSSAAVQFPAFYMVQASVTPAGIEGSFMGSFGAEEVSGGVEGRLEEVPDAPDEGSVIFCMDGAFRGGTPAQNWIRLRVDFKEGEVTGGGVRNADRDVDAIVSGGKLTWSQELLSGNVIVELAEGSGATAGRYIFEFAGPSVGRRVAGLFTVYVASEPATRSGRFLAELEMASGR
jgi:hypothetical protein